MTEETKAATAPTQPSPQARELPVDASQLSTAYANYVRASGTPEELVLDFGLYVQAGPIPTEPVKLTHRLVMNFYTAKRLLGLLHLAVQQYEKAYGPVETEAGKRARAAARPGPSSGPGGS